MSFDADILADELHRKATRESIPEANLAEYDRLIQRRLTPAAALQVIKGRNAERALATAEPVADAVVRSLTGQPPRVELPELDAIVKAIR